MKQACSIAEGMKTQNTMSEKVQRIEFEKLWSSWIQGQGPQSSSTTTDDTIRNVVLGAIQKRLSSNYKYAMQELKTCPIVTSPVQPIHMLISKINQRTVTSEDFIFHTSLVTKVINYFSDKRHMYTQLAITYIKEKVLPNVQDFLARLPKTD